MNYVVYCVTNHINGKTYIGVHRTENINDDYMGSGKLVKLAIKKYGIENFSKKILFCFDNAEEMFETERQCILEMKPDYNLHPGGSGSFEYINDVVLTDDKRKLGRRNANKVLEEKYGEGYQTILGQKGVAALKAKNPNHMKEMQQKSLAKAKIFGGTFLGKTHTDETKSIISEKAKVHQKGSRNSQYGTCWIKNLDSMESKKIDKNDLSIWESRGWIKGRFT